MEGGEGEGHNHLRDAAVVGVLVAHERRVEVGDEASLEGRGDITMS